MTGLCTVLSRRVVEDVSNFGDNYDHVLFNNYQEECNESPLLNCNVVVEVHMLKFNVVVEVYYYILS